MNGSGLPASSVSGAPPSFFTWNFATAGSPGATTPTSRSASASTACGGAGVGGAGSGGRAAEREQAHERGGGAHERAIETGVLPGWVGTRSR